MWRGGPVEVRWAVRCGQRWWWKVRCGRRGGRVAAQRGADGEVEVRRRGKVRMAMAAGSAAADGEDASQWAREPMDRIRGLCFFYSF